MNIRRAAPLNCASVCFQTVFNSAVTVNSIPKLSTDQVIGELLLAESLRRYEEAIGYYNKSLEIDSRNANVWNNKGNALSKLGRSVEAIECYDKALTLGQ